MSGFGWSYPPGVTGNEPELTGEWDCARCDDTQDGNAPSFRHPETGDDYCEACHEFMVETEQWPEPETETEDDSNG